MSRSQSAAFTVFHAKGRTIMLRRIAALAAITAFSMLATQSLPARSAESGHSHEEAEQGGTGTDGVPGKASEVRRTIRIEARDLAFNVKQIQVRAGETLRFVVTNSGKLRHEFVIASHAEHVEHRTMMRQMPNMEMEKEPNAVTIDPGQTKELIWKFGKDSDVEFACDIPGHAESGMDGVFRVMQ
jgi:uncharacterized cupredoxin-like copper-binding protein